MAQFRLSSGGSVSTFLIDTQDGASKDPGPNSAPTAGPNTPVNTGGAKSVALNFSSTADGGQILSTLNNPG